jgi:hypothetical protein
MVQIQSPSCGAMALALKDVQTFKITVAELGLASDGTSIMAPFLDKRQTLILDLKLKCMRSTVCVYACQPAC